MKPKKALKSLFTSTENPEDTQVAAAQVSTEQHSLSQDALQDPATDHSIVLEQSSNDLMPESVSVGLRNDPQNSNSESRDAPVTSFDLLALSRNFTTSASLRASWTKDNYVHMLKELEIKQTEVFFLKGKLLNEIKERFFESNKVGWVDFCESTLGVYYTTANQYIRVAKEFDVMSHHRADLSYEHYKALLPLDSSMREDILESVKNISVKDMRALVVKRLNLSEKNENSPKKNKETIIPVTLNSIYELNQKLSESENLLESMKEPKDKWQVIAALESLSKTALETVSNLKMVKRSGGASEDFLLHQRFAAEDEVTIK